jgi:hypothetical protein
MLPMTHLLIDPLPAIPALDRVLDDGVLREVLIQRGQAIQREANTHKVEQPIQEEPRRHLQLARSSLSPTQ